MFYSRSILLYNKAILNSVIDHLENYGIQESEEAINYIQSMEGMFGANKELFNRSIEKLHNIIGRERARLTAELRNKRSSMRTPRPPTRDQGANNAGTSTGGSTPQGRGRRPNGTKRTRSRSAFRPRRPNAGQGQQGQGKQGFRGRRPQPRGTARGGARRQGQYRMTPQNPAPANQQQQGQDANFRNAVMQGLQVMMNSLNMPQ